MKKLLIAVTLTAGVLSLTACNSDDSEKEAVVETEAGNITKDAFYKELKDKSGEQVLQQMVITKLLEDKYDVPKGAVDAEIQKLKDQYGDQFEMALQQSGFKDEKAYREVVKLSLLQQAAATEDIEIPEKEIKEYYDRMKTQIQASHILVADEKTAKEVEKKLKDGGDFAELAKEYSTDKGTATKGGKLGYFSVGKMVPEFTDAAYSLEVGEVSEPVKSQFGYHIIKVTDKRDTKEDIGSYKEEKNNIRRELASKKVDPTKAQAKIQKLIDNAKIDVVDDQFEGLFEKPEKPKAQEPAAEDKSKSDEAKKEEDSKKDDSKKDDASKEEDAK